MRVPPLLIALALSAPAAALPPQYDQDGDGRLNAEDRCPEEPEDLDGFEDADGCPEPDNDQDKIMDVEDQCPNTPEDFDGFEDADGCPEPDNDHDGILDIKDHCPMKPEDRDGFEDDDGCPDLDNDGDGVPDVDDLCPMQPDIHNGYSQGTGCHVDPPTLISPIPLEIREAIHFAPGGVKIRPQHRRVLDEIVRRLKAHPEIGVVQVEGHQDGREPRYTDLSKARAKAARIYLLKRGVRAERLEVVGYGPTRPLAPNSDESGRAKNRRVEFRVLKP